MGYLLEDPRSWKKWWVGMWLVFFVTLLAAAFFVTFNVWSILAVCLFGVPESLALLRPADGYPPLTHVTRYYAPKWLTFTTLYFFTGWIGSYWLGARHPLRQGALIGLIGWLNSHFDTVYEEG